MVYLVLLTLLSLVLAMAAVALAVMARRRLHRMVEVLGVLEARLGQAEASARRADEAVLVMAAVLMDQGMVAPRDIAAAREVLLDRPRRLEAEREELLRGVQDRDGVLERLVNVPFERKH